MKRILSIQILKANLIPPEFPFFFWYFLFLFFFFLFYSFATFKTLRVMSFGGLSQFYIRLNSPSSRIRKIKGVLPVYMFSKIIHVEMFQLGKYWMFITSRVLDGFSEECFNRQESNDLQFFLFLSWRSVPSVRHLFQTCHEKFNIWQHEDQLDILNAS